MPRLSSHFRTLFAVVGLTAHCGSSAAVDPRLHDASVEGAALDGGADLPSADAAVDGLAPDAGNADSPSNTDAPLGGDDLTRVPGWSVRKRLRSTAGADLVLEDVPVSYLVAPYGTNRVRLLAGAGSPERSWAVPSDRFISDLCWHPSGAVSAVLLAPDRTVSLARLAADLTLLSTRVIHDPAIAGDPNANDAGAQDLLANGFATDAARIAAVGEDVVAVVDTSWNSIVAYRASFTGAWSDPRRTLLEPPAALTPFLPISGSFDTFGAIVAWYRSPLDVDEDGNAYVAVWADPSRIAAHVAAFRDGLTARPDDASAPWGESDVLVSKMDPQGARVWSRVIGTEHEDEPYAIRARGGFVAVVGRSRRFPGIDNTAWDAFVGVTSAAGDPVIARTLALDASGIFLAVDLPAQGGLILAGSDGWSQNPSGLSVTSYGAKLLLTLGAFDAAPTRLPLVAGPRHNEIRTVTAGDGVVWFGGDEDGPIMHTGDSDLTQIHATGVLGRIAR